MNRWYAVSDDIVTRLQMFSLDDGTDALNKLLAESADEIERLREELKQTKKELHEAQYELQKVWTKYTRTLRR